MVERMKMKSASPKLNWQAKDRMGRACGMADTLCCLELDVARYQDRIARSTANFVCGDSLSDRDHRAFSSFDWSRAIASYATRTTTQCSRSQES